MLLVIVVVLVIVGGGASWLGAMWYAQQLLLRDLLEHHERHIMRTPIAEVALEHPGGCEPSGASNRVTFGAPRRNHKYNSVHATSVLQSRPRRDGGSKWMDWKFMAQKQAQQANRAEASRGEPRRPKAIK